MIIVVLFGSFLPYEGHKGDLMAYYPSSPYITHVTSRGVSVIFPCWGRGEFQPPLTSRVS